MVIHLGNLRRVEVDEANLRVAYEGGCLWSDVDGALAARGLVIDNLVSLQMVLADGSVVEASETQHPDLFWAMRGAGSMFGVVTRFVSRAHRQGDVWSGTLVFAPDKLGQLVAVTNDLHSRDDLEGHCLALSIGYGPDGTTRALTVVPLFHGPEAEARDYLAGLLRVEAAGSDVRMMTVARLNGLNAKFEHGLRRLMGSCNVTMPLSAAGLQETADMLWSFCDGHGGMGTSAAIVEFFPTRKLREVPQDGTAHANRGDHYDAALSFGWADPALDDEVRQLGRRVREQIVRTTGHGASGGGGGGGDGKAGPAGRYVNMEAEPVRPEEAYGDNVERLRGPKARWDADNVFHSWFGVAG
ncbi:hypothetical protein CDD83_7478 [Cordyceps sp. RAO-2017]|nr:hypothetical protein CDD83_7478 [Cordyceps sp. RAO-2017]